jgi:hypothetical protein
LDQDVVIIIIITVIVKGCLQKTLLGCYEERLQVRQERFLEAAMSAGLKACCWFASGCTSRPH